VSSGQRSFASSSTLQAASTSPFTSASTSSSRYARIRPFCRRRCAALNCSTEPKKTSAPEGFWLQLRTCSCASLPQSARHQPQKPHGHLLHLSAKQPSKSTKACPQPARGHTSVRILSMMCARATCTLRERSSRAMSRCSSASSCFFHLLLQLCLHLRPDCLEPSLQIPFEDVNRQVLCKVSVGKARVAL